MCLGMLKVITPWFVFEFLYRLMTPGLSKDIRHHKQHLYLHKDISITRQLQSPVTVIDLDED